MLKKEQSLPSRGHPPACAKGTGSSVALSLVAIPRSNPRQSAEDSSGHQESSRRPQRLWERNALAGTLAPSPAASIYGPALPGPITPGSQVTHWGGREGGRGCLFLAPEWICAGAELSAPVKGTASCCAGRIFLRGSLNGSITGLDCGTGRMQLCDLSASSPAAGFPPAGFGLCCISLPRARGMERVAVAC